MKSLQSLESLELTEKELVFSHSAYDRFKGAEWFTNVLNRPVLVIGTGGIGSWTSLLLARCGVDLYLYDMDTVSAHNIAGQLFSDSQVGQNKTQAIEKTIEYFCMEPKVTVFPEKYTEDSIQNNIVIMGVDNMEARKVGFENWLKYVQEHPEERCLFIDGRLSTSLLQIFCLTSDNPEGIREYQENHLPDDSQVPDEDCTNKQTSFCAAMIASHMVAFFTNWMNPLQLPNSVPFCYQYLIPINYTTNDSITKVS